MKILAVGDMHIKSNTLSVMERARDSIVSLVSRERPDYVVLLGDQLDGHDQLQLSCLSCLSHLVESLTKTCSVVMLVGNHDMINNQQFCPEEHAFYSMKHLPNLTVVDRPQVVNSEAAHSGEEPALLCTPYVPRGMFEEAMDLHVQEEWKDWRDRRSDVVVFAHQEFRGVVMNQVTSVKGDVYGPDWPVVVSGHIHERQTIGNNVIYVGTPWNTSFVGGRSKTVMLMDFDCGGDVSDFEVNLVELEGVPRWVIQTCRASQISDVTLEEGCMNKVTVLGDSRVDLDTAKKVVRSMCREREVWRKARFLYLLDHQHLMGDSEGKEASELGVDSLSSIRKNFSGSTMKRLVKLIEASKDSVDLRKVMESISSGGT